MPLISVSDYSFRYAGTKAFSLSDISFDIARGEFVLLCGETGSGKTTLLRSLKREIAPVGERSGRLEIASGGAESASIGFVAQNPDNQIVTDSVWHELSFGLENLGTEPSIIRRRVAEIANFFALEPWLHKRVSELSGGQKQILSLAACLVMQPDILLLDEPTAQLDPIAAKEFLRLLERVHDDLGTTVIICEHDLSDVLPQVGRVLYMHRGRLEIDCPPQDFIREIYSRFPSFEAALPVSVRLHHALSLGGDYPLTVREGHDALSHAAQRIVSAPRAQDAPSGEVVLRARDAWYRYDRGEPFVLQGASIDLRRGEIHAIVGGNGSGKSTLLYLLSEVYKPTRGSVRRDKARRIGMLSQNPQSLLICDRLGDELREWQDRFGYTDDDIDRIAAQMELSHLMERHPYDLSGGEIQKAAMAKVLLLEPDILLLDEPTKGVDIISRGEIARILRRQRDIGRTVVLVTHDLEFAATVSDRCSMLFGGQIVCTDRGRDFFCSNVFYTTAIARLTRGICDAVSMEDVVIDEP
ncbi:MAG: ATP-binding cassette domain-containing protein [Clostridia bacterium]|nr:ATP-binding cassette domain-containing protein [Clostridia bacterium]